MQAKMYYELANQAWIWENKLDIHQIIFWLFPHTERTFMQLLFSFLEFFWWHHNLENSTVNILQNIFCVLRKKKVSYLEHYV